MEEKREENMTRVEEGTFRGLYKNVPGFPEGALVFEKTIRMILDGHHNSSYLPHFVPIEEKKETE